MSEVIKDLLAKEIESEFNNLSTISSEGEEKSNAIDDLSKLYRLRLEEIETELEFEEKAQRRAMDIEDNKEQNRIQYIKLAVEAAGVVLPLMFYAAWMNRGFRFEESGTFTSTTFRGLFNRFKPTK